MTHKVLAEGQCVRKAEGTHGALQHEGGRVDIHGVVSPVVVAVLQVRFQGILAGELLAAHFA